MYTINRFVCIVLVVLASDIFAAPTKKNSKDIVWHECRKSDPKFLQCFQNELQNVIPHLVDGYPKFRIPPIDPFELPRLDIAKGSGAVAIDLSLQKLQISGLTSAKLMQLKVDPNKLEGYAKVNFGKPITLAGQYTAKGKVQVLAINGKGPCNITLINPILELYDLKGEPIEKHGVKYIVAKTIKLRALKVDKIILNFENLFQGNPELSKNLNVFLNENWELLYDELKPAFEEAVVAIIKDIVQKVLTKIALDQVFPA